MNVTSGNSGGQVFQPDTSDLISANLEQKSEETFQRFSKLPQTLAEWELHKTELQKKIKLGAKVVVNKSFPLDCIETGLIQRQGYKIKKIFFQTRKDVYATANLYVPDGAGPFPAVLNMHGHWPNGKAGDMVQACAHELAMKGYVCLNIDAWGAGERTTIHGEHEYHGSNLGSTLLDLGETLLGNQLSDNIRAVDLLCSLPYVDKSNIGATGASGGGNQTMWLAAIDERIKAAIPVVSVGTFQSYILGSNCVCELLPEGLTFTEETGVLAMVAPRALKIFSALKDHSKAFQPSEMLRSYHNAKPVFELYNKGDDISYKLFDTTHGYWPEMRKEMIAFFDEKLKNGNGQNNPSISCQLLSPEELSVFKKERDKRVLSTAMYSNFAGMLLTRDLYTMKPSGLSSKRKELGRLLILDNATRSVKRKSVRSLNNGWQSIIFETGDGRLLSAKYRPPANESKSIVLILPSDTSSAFLKERLTVYKDIEYGILVSDVWGKGSNSCQKARNIDGRLPEYHTLLRSKLWFGETIMSEWVKDINSLVRYIKESGDIADIIVEAEKELAIAALFQATVFDNIKELRLTKMPLSYVFSEGPDNDFYNMGIHVPGILKWGDIALAMGLIRNAKISFLQSASTSGTGYNKEQIKAFKNHVSQIRRSLLIKGNINIF